MRKPLDSRPARMDLTDRECSKLIGGLLGSLATMTDLKTLRTAVYWWAETDEAWTTFQHYLTQQPQQQNPKTNPGVKTHARKRGTRRRTRR